MKTITLTLGCLVVGFCLLSREVQALTPAQLKQLLGQGDPVILIDIRNAALFQKHHIVGAINIPFNLIEQKSLPPMGRVIVYGDGLGKEFSLKAVQLLNKKPGIKAEALEGGYAAWLAIQGSTTQASGLHNQTWDIISYEDLKNAEDAVIIDLRKPKRLARQGMDSSNNDTAPLTDLGKEFPNAKISKSPFETPKTRQGIAQTAAVQPLIVLVDDGDGSNAAETQAKVLRANGLRRVVILAGGESIIVRKGKPGLQRQGVVLGNNVQK